MEHSFWFNRWETDQIAFHETDVHPILTRHWNDFRVTPGATVFVPLCGKSNDLPWIRRQGHEVLGVELSPIAVSAFFAENKVKATISDRDSFKYYTGSGYRILCGDYFDINRENTGKIGAVYDRAALIALTPEQRVDYVRHLSTLLDPEAKILLITVRYEPKELTPPPFIVDEDEIEVLYGTRYSVECLGTSPALIKGNPGEEIAYRMEKR